jgi:flagellar biosynthesis/type III secretory pathway protein FliH
VPNTAEVVSPFTFEPLEPPTVRGQDALAAAMAEADAIRQAAHAQGEAEGRAQSERAVRAQFEDALLLVAEAHGALDELREEYLHALSCDAVSLGLRLAEQIVAGAVAVAPERLVDVAELMLRRLADRRQVTLIVNPAELDVISASITRLRSELGGIDHLGVQADRRVSHGSVIARTEDGEIDATIEAQLERAREIVAAELGRTVA